MPIRAFLGDASFSPEEVSAMSTAFNDVLKTLSLKRDDPIAEIAAGKIIEAARQGELDPQRLAALAVKYIQQWSGTARRGPRKL
jgi:hypothetical protein